MFYCRYLIAFFIFSTFYSLNVQAKSIQKWQTARENLDYVYIKEPFRIFYSLKGNNALAKSNQHDTNDNGTPDFIENIAARLQFSYQTFNHSFNLTSPIKSPRYNNKISNIDIHFIKLQIHGSSGSGVHFLNYKSIKGKAKGALIISLSSTLNKHDLSPEHELFHAYQYGYTLFKNRWFIEGTARWSEYVFKDNTGSQKKLPQTVEQLQKVLSKSYGAKYLWRRLAYLCDTNKKRYFPHKETNIGDIKKLYPTIDFKIYGHSFIKKLLENLSKQDRQLTKIKGMSGYNWKHSEQKSSLNNKYILLALKHTIAGINYKKKQEMKKFLNVVDEYLHQLTKLNSKDVTQYLKYIGNPFSSHYQKGEHIYSRNIRDMFKFNNLIFIGAGNASNKGPSPNSGPVPIISYNPEKNIFYQEGLIDDEQLNVFRKINQQLYIPGHDATTNTKYGNYYHRTNSKTWKKYNNIPKALHVFDINKYQNKFFAATGTAKGAAIAISNDNGKRWTNHYVGKRQRVYDLLKINNKFFAFKQVLHKKKRLKLPIKAQEKYYSVIEYSQDKLTHRPDLTAEKLFPETNIKANKTLHFSRSLSFDDKAIYIGAYYFNRPFSFYIANSLNKDNIKIQRIKIPLFYVPRDMIIRNETIYLLCSQEEETGFKNVVLSLSIRQQLKPAKDLFHFTSTTFARSFEEYNGDFYFGMGYNVKSQNRWTEDEIDLETGKIYKLNQRVYLNY